MAFVQNTFSCLADGEMADLISGKHQHARCRFRIDQYTQSPTVVQGSHKRAGASNNDQLSYPVPNQAFSVFSPETLRDGGEADPLDAFGGECPDSQHVRKHTSCRYFVSLAYSKDTAVLVAFWLVCQQAQHGLLAGQKGQSQADLDGNWGASVWHPLPQLQQAGVSSEVMLSSLLFSVF